MKDGDSLEIFWLDESNQLILIPGIFVSDIKCFQSYEDILTAETMMCAQELIGSHDEFCNGPGGVPMTFETVLVGIGSWGYGCAMPEYPGVYAQIDAYLDWIAKEME